MSRGSVLGCSLSSYFEALREAHRVATVERFSRSAQEFPGPLPAAGAAPRA